MDGNAYFFTAVDVARRLEYTNDTRTVIVGIGYPSTRYVYDFRRGPDLTPPTVTGVYEKLIGSDGKAFDIAFGEADEFLEFIRQDVMTHIHNKLFPQASLITGRKALFGHSYGGAFALNALYTMPTLFSTFIAASPEIWFNNNSLVREQEETFRRLESPVKPFPSLLMTWGSGRQHLKKRPDESEEAFKERESNAEDEKMRESAMALVSRLENCPSLRNVSTFEFPGEDHGSAAVTGLQWGLVKFLVEGF